MLQHCPKTCGLCDEVVEFEVIDHNMRWVPVTIWTYKNCIDNSPSCQRRSYLCKIPLYKNIMKMECAYTCGFCGR
uniref:ShKT domain-containing protein n=1 Tax=Acrobeloides nanus TaxID=290746 RepID=A0A914DUF4_9BILA